MTAATWHTKYSTYTDEELLRIVDTGGDNVTELEIELAARLLGYKYKEDLEDGDDS